MTNKKLFAMAILFMVGMMACQKQADDESATGENAADVETAAAGSNKGQAFIENDQSQPSVLHIAMDSKDHTTLVAAVQAAGLENVLVNAGPFTVFAPTNAAFDALPEGTVENLLKPENKSQLKNILEYHVTPATYDMNILSKVGHVGQANGMNIPVEMVDGKPMVGGANIIATVRGGNGIVHVIDRVLLPPSEN